MKKYNIFPVAAERAHKPDHKWTIMVEQEGRSTPTFQFFETIGEAQLMVARLLTSVAKLIPR